MNDEQEFIRLNYPRVSDIIGRQNLDEIRSIPLETFANACIRGTKVHDYCTTLVKGLWLPDIEPEYSPYVTAFMDWFEKHVHNVLYTNVRLYDDDKRFTGEFDMIVTLKDNKQTAMLDIKTSANVSKTWAIQLAAYKHLSELNGYKPDTYINVHLKKTKAGTFEIAEGKKILIVPPVIKVVTITHENLIPYWEIFASALKCYDFFVRKEAV